MSFYKDKVNDEIVEVLNELMKSGASFTLHFYIKDFHIGTLEINGDDDSQTIEWLIEKVNDTDLVSFGFREKNKFMSLFFFDSYDIESDCDEYSINYTEYLN